MPDTSFECPDCDAVIQSERILTAIADQGIADEIVEGESDLMMDCPHCESTITFQAANVLVRLSADDETLTLLRTLQKTAEAPTTTNWEPDFEEVIERERESQRRREQIEENLRDIRDSL